MSAQKLGQLQPFIAAFPQGCVGQLACFGPTYKRPARSQCVETGPGAHVCECDPGWAGPTCATDSNPCDDAPCANGGACVELYNDYEWCGRFSSVQNMVLA